MSNYFKLKKPVGIAAYSSCGGPKEENGPIGNYIDIHFKDDKTGEKSYEKAECKMFESVVQNALCKSGLKKQNISFMSGGDLLNQIISSNFSARDLAIPFIGLYGACSTFAESIAINSMLLSAGYGEYAISVASSHFSTAERQYRFPLEFAKQRKTTSQWTVTGAGAIILTSHKKDVQVTDVTIGKVIDFGITDAENMGAAMAPAALDTLEYHIKNSGNRVEDYDYIITGDLGKLGSDILLSLAKEKNLDINNRHIDCGIEIFDSCKDDCGGSGCACSAIVITSKYLRMLSEKKIKKILYIATGALLSPISTMQGESIPSIAHAVTIEGTI